MFLYHNILLKNKGVSVDERQLEQLEQQIRQYGFCAVVEVTNGYGLSKSGIEDKIDQAVRGRDFLCGLTKNSVPIYTGLIFFRNRKVLNFQNKDLDFLLQMKGYEKEKSLEALERTESRLKEEGNRRITNDLITLVKQGANLEGLFYPKNWQTFRTAFPALASVHSPEEYMDLIGHVKGSVLEEYNKIILGETISNAAIYGPLKHAWRTGKGLTKRKLEMDIVIAGAQNDVMRGLNNKHYFAQHIMPELNYSSSFKTSSS